MTTKRQRITESQAVTHRSPGGAAFEERPKIYRKGSLGVVTRADKQFSTKNWDWLAEGRYKEWFWQGLSPEGVAFIKAPVKTLKAPEPEPIYQNKTFPQVKRWRDEAACAEADPRIFFVEGEGVDPKQEYMKPDAEWRQYCPQCPVRELCLELARDSESVGIFGGKLFAHQTGSSAFNTVLEFDETNMPKRGRPRANPGQVMTSAERSRNHRLRKKENAGISST